MASELAAPEMVAHAARIMGVRSQDALLKSDQSVDKLEYGARRIGGLHGPVEHRLIRV